ncbi:hypothetical protein SDC9_181051 [bioreactor metagenome]|uniref:Uncharacterized protein n=1 Tax=bioreactor metagenome TaxID=1076179 RepID=A0A645H5E4_9ZZZZ
MFGNRAQGITACMQIAPDHAGEDGDDEQLEEHDQAIEMGDKANAAQIHADHQRGQADDPDPVVDLGEHGGQIDPGQQDIDHGREQVVQQ